MMALWNLIWRGYLVLAAIVMAGAIYGIATRQPPRGIECPRPVAPLDYAVFVAFRGALWPYAMYVEAIRGGVAPQDWIILHYDALRDACDWAGPANAQ